MRVGHIGLFLLLGGTVQATHEQHIPFPDALDAAEVVQSKITDIGREALVLGNGDLNALLWERDGSLCLRVTKNDIWDARIDTSRDPELMTMDIKNRTWKGGALRRVPSWHETPYPIPRCAAVVVIGQPDASGSVAGPWRRIRSGKKDAWGYRDGVGVMSVEGDVGVSAGYGCRIRGVKTTAAGSLKLGLSGSTNARYFVDVFDSNGQALIHSGWMDVPVEAQEASFPLPKGRTVSRLDLYVWSKDGSTAEVLYDAIRFETGAAETTIDLSLMDTPGRTAQLDLRRAVAVLGDKGATSTAIRCLADRNVFLIEGPGEVSLEEVRASYLPGAELGETDGVKWLRMKMPGDVDYPGMEYALAVVAEGEIKAVSLVTSYDVDGDVLKAAFASAREVAATEQAQLVRAHESIWAQYWSASGLELSDQFFQEAWYRNVYYMRCFCRAGTTMPITLYAGLATDRPGWHGAPTLNYNVEQTFWAMIPCNQVELMEPYVRYMAGFAPRARWLAKKTYGIDGLYYPSNIFGPEYLVPPESAKSKNHRQILYIPWSYTLGMTGMALQNVWLRYKYQPDQTYLASVYPLIRDAAQFYASVIEMCRDDDEDGKVELGPSFNPEHGPFGTFNNPYDIAYFNFLLKAACEAADRLERDRKLVNRWQSALGLIPAYETTPVDRESVVANWMDATAQSVPVHNIVCPTVPIFPAEQITWFSSPEDKDLFERTVRWIKHNGNNSHVMLSVAKARLSMPEAYTDTKAHFGSIATPNGLFAAWPGHGAYLAESWAFAGLVAELLLQSVDDIIRVFPAWPEEHDAKFTDLRAQGGFLVSAEQKGGKIVRLQLESTAGGPLRLLSPWGTVKANGKTLAPDARGVVEVETRMGETIVLEP